MNEFRIRVQIIIRSIIFLFPILSFFLKDLYGQEQIDNLSFYPEIVEVTGSVYYYNSEGEKFSVLDVGMIVKKPTLFITSESSEIVFSCKGGIAGLINEHSRVLLSPAFDQHYEADLRLGTITVLLDPSRPNGKPTFGVNTLSGRVEAEGTLFALTRYKGQTYSSVKRGKIKKITKTPTKSDFVSYIKKAKTTAMPLKSSNKKNSSK